MLLTCIWYNVYILTGGDQFQVNVCENERVTFPWKLPLTLNGTGVDLTHITGAKLTTILSKSPNSQEPYMSRKRLELSMDSIRLRHASTDDGGRYVLTLADNTGITKFREVFVAVFPKSGQHYNNVKS